MKMSLQEKLAVLDRLDEEIISLMESEDAIVREIEQSDAFQQEVFAIMVRIDKLPYGTRSLSHTAPAVTTTSSGAVSNVKLPKLTIAPFSGSLTDWMMFWDSYKTATEENPSLTEVERFSYTMCFRSLLRGPALEAISGLALTAANYKQAVAVLQKRFGDKQVIISRHMDELMNLEAVHSDHHLRDLRKLYDRA